MIRFFLGAFAIAVLFAAAYEKGASDVQAQWEMEKQTFIAATEALRRKQTEATVQVVTKYVDRTKVVREQGQTISEVAKNVPSTVLMPRGFRVLHDAATVGVYPETPGIADEIPVTAEDVAVTVVDNYTTCREVAAQLEALQQWANEVSK